MTAEVTLSNLWWNKGLAGFYFRVQAYDTLEDLVNRIGGQEDQNAFYDLEERIDEVYSSVDDFEEDCYSCSVEDLLETLGYETNEEY